MLFLGVRSSNFADSLTTTIFLWILNFLRLSAPHSLMFFVFCRSKEMKKLYFFARVGIFILKNSKRTIVTLKIARKVLILTFLHGSHLILVLKLTLPLSSFFCCLFPLWQVQISIKLNLYSNLGRVFTIREYSYS